jgi:NAD(P)H-dependent FMN reductase
VSRLVIIVGSTRPGRAGQAVAEWFIEQARQDGGFAVDVADLAEIDLPLLDEPEHPRFGRYRHQHTKEWSRRIELADAIVVITPEYNHGYPATVKNALDYLHAEWADKPIAFVSYGGVSGGTRAVAQLKTVVTALRMVPIVESVNIPFFTERIDDSGDFHPNEVTEHAADAVLDELARLDSALRPLRKARQQAA